MASQNGNIPREDVISQLTECFGNNFTIDIIRSVAMAANFNLERATACLCEMAVQNNERAVDLPVPTEFPQSSSSELYQKELTTQRVIEFVKEGWKVLILLRGLPGSGKSYLADMIFNETVSGYNKQDFVLSADDYFWNKGIYNYNSNNLSDAHKANQRRCFTSMKKGYSPIIIDNTNIQVWEMKPYCFMASEFGYCIEVIEPATPWAYNVQMLAKKNIHHVGREKLIDMSRRYEKNITPAQLSIMCDLQYKHKLPQRRKIPPVNLSRRTFEKGNETAAWNSPSRVYSVENIPMEYVHPVEQRNERFQIPEYIHEFKTTDNMREISSQSMVNDQTNSQTRLASIDDFDTFQLNKISLLEPKKESKEKSPEFVDVTTDTRSNTAITDQSSHNTHNVEEIINRVFEKISKQMFFNKSSTETKEVKENKETVSNPYTSNNLAAWGVSDAALASWEIVSPLPKVDAPQLPLEPDINAKNTACSETVDQCTNTSAVDFNIAKQCLPQKGIKILASQNRVISEGIIQKPSTPPKKHLLDKSSMTNEEVLVAAVKRGYTQTDHLEKLLQLFPKENKELLSDFYIKCQRDINWTVDLLMENPETGFTSKCDHNDKSVDNQIEANDAAMNLEETHDLISFDIEPTEEEPLLENDDYEKEKRKLQEREELKKYLEETVDIKKEHYSDKLWQIINFKRGTPLKTEETQNKQPTVDTFSSSPTYLQTTPTPSFQNGTFEDTSVYISDDECENENECEDDNLVELNLGPELASQLENMFGSLDMGQFEPVVQMPESFARQLHALYLESMCRQMENQCDAMQTLLKEDEALAKKLQDEEEHSLVQQQQQVSDLKEIMDEQLALNLYRKDVDKWKNMTPDDLASKLTRQKLFECFPSINKDLLVEILQAHNNNYKQTIATLLDSTDPNNIQVSQEELKQPPISDSTLEEMKLAQEMITNTTTPEDELKPAKSYRIEANEHMRKRKEILEKVQMYKQRGMNEVAAFYTNIARQQLHLAELANQKATCRYLEQNASKLTSHTTLDLHYLFVKEAIHTLDVFIDHHISCLAKSKKSTENLYIITGRGKRSEGGISRLRPAVINRLKKRNIQCHAVNLGLLRVKIHKNLLMSTNLNNGK